MNLRQLEQFVAVAETGSFSHGAARVHSSQPALSTAISKLEDELGVRLLSRRKRSVALTADGRQLLTSARTILAECDNVRTTFRKAVEREDLRIGVCETLDLKRLAASLEQFRRANTGVRLSVFEADSASLAERLLAGDLEAAFLVSVVQETPAGGFQAHLLGKERYMLAVPDDHPLAGARSADIAELDGAPFVARTHCEYRNFLAQILSENDIRPLVTYRTSQDDRALELVRAGLGAGIFPQSLIPAGVSALEISDQRLERQIYLVWKHRRPLPAILDFREFVERSRVF